MAKRKMINLSKTAAKNAEQLKIAFAVFLSRDISYSEMFELLFVNRQLVVGALKLMGRIK